VKSQFPKSIHDLRPSEGCFFRAMHDLGHGRFESVRIRDGELVLDPWPAPIRSVKFGNATPNRPVSASADFELKYRVTEFFACVRTIKSGVIRVLEVRGGLPFCMDVTELPTDHENTSMFET
jgi:hypothetical protein